eukprot:5836997-Pleurochrysis_carterae.AAC.1
MCSRSRTGGGPPSGAVSDEKKREIEKVEQGGEATIAVYEPTCSAREGADRRSRVEGCATRLRRNRDCCRYIQQ